MKDWRGEGVVGERSSEVVDFKFVIIKNHDISLATETLLGYLVGVHTVVGRVWDADGWWVDRCY